MEPVIKTYTKRPTKANPNLVCCRACLQTEGKLYNMHEYNIVETFSRISGMPVKEDKFPQHLCAYCIALLRRCDEFKAKCSRAKLCLLSELMARNLTMEYIRTIDRLYHRLVDLKTTEVQVTDYTTTPVEDTPQEPQAVEDEINDGGDFIEDAQENDIQNLSNFNMEVNYINDNEVKINGDLFVIKNVDDILKPKQTKTLKISKPRKKKSKILEKSTDTNGEVQVMKRRRKRKPKRPYRSATNNYLPVFDFAKFESTYGVKIIVLSKEEQIKEMEARRASVKYLAAKYRCEPCGKFFSTETIYNNHRREHSLREGAFECDICAMSFRKCFLLMKHKDTHSLKLVCECGFISRTRDQAKKHHEMHKGRKFVCHHCGKCFSVFTSYMSHLRLGHPDMNVVCDLCGEAFIGSVGLRSHKTRMHSVKWREKLNCAICSVEFVTPEALNRHTESGEHVGRSPCTYCGQNFDSQEALESHMTRQHPHCHECSQSFIDLASYKTHYRRKHVGKHGGKHGGKPLHRSLQCDQCVMEFPNMNRLRLHMISGHPGIKLGLFHCDECPYMCNAASDLKAHKRKHTGEKPFQCDHCKMSISSKANLQRHMLVMHLGKRARIPCEICGKTVTTHASLRLHINTVHLGMPWPKRVRKRPNKKPSENEDSDSE